MQFQCTVDWLRLREDRKSRHEDSKTPSLTKKFFEKLCVFESSWRDFHDFSPQTGQSTVPAESRS